MLCSEIKLLKKNPSPFQSPSFEFREQKLNQEKNPSPHHRRKEEPCLPPSAAVRGLSLRVFVRRSQCSFILRFFLCSFQKSLNDY
ncbi:hypothetical protein AHAS_Ahas18G0238900 [Arachis hypogaea]